jgi:hypothetical protein
MKQENRKDKTKKNEEKVGAKEKSGKRPRRKRRRILNKCNMQRRNNG